MEESSIPDVSILTLYVGLEQAGSAAIRELYLKPFRKRHVQKLLVRIEFRLVVEPGRPPMITCSLYSVCFCVGHATTPAAVEKSWHHSSNFLEL